MSNLASIGRLQISRASGSIGLGKYRVFASLGRGGMADVHLGAVQGPKGFNKLVVVKRLRPLLADDPAVVNMFLDEARLAARLNHPNLIHSYEFGEEHGTLLHRDGGSWRASPSTSSLHVRPAGRKRQVSPCLWAKVIADALAGILQYAHELRDYDGTPLGIVHRERQPPEHRRHLRRRREAGRFRDRQGGDERHQDRVPDHQGQARVHGARAGRPSRGRAHRPAGGHLLRWASCSGSVWRRPG